MAGDEVDLVTEWEELFLDRANEGLVIAARKISPSNRSLEEHVANLGQVAGCMVENDMPRRVSRTVQDVQLNVAETHRITALKPARGLEAAYVGKSKHLALLLHAFDPEAVFLMRTFNKIDPGRFRQRRHATGVIDVAMRHEYFGQRQAFIAQGALNALDIATGINGHRLTGLFAPENRAVLFKGGNRNNKVAHDRRAMMNQL